MLLGAARREARGSGAGLQPGVRRGSARALPDSPPQPLAPCLLPGQHGCLDHLACPVRGLSGKRRRAAGRECRIAPAEGRGMDVGGGQERPPVDTSARGSDSGGLVKGTYVRGGACVGPEAHVPRELEWTSGASKEDIRTPRSHAWTLSLEGRCADRPGRPRVRTPQAEVVSSLVLGILFCVCARAGMRPSRLVHRRFKPHTNSKNKVKLHPRPVGDEERSCWGGLVPPHLGAGTRTGRQRTFACVESRPRFWTRGSSSAATRRGNLALCGDAGHRVRQAAFPWRASESGDSLT